MTCQSNSGGRLPGGLQRPGADGEGGGRCGLPRRLRRQARNRRWVLCGLLSLCVSRCVKVEKECRQS